MKEERNKAEISKKGAQVKMIVYQPEGVYERLCLCEYLRDLPEGPVFDAGETDKEASVFSS
jgi:hypothetical protein